MKSLLIAAIVAYLMCRTSFAQEKPLSGSAQTAKPTTEELEAKFKATMTKAVMSGRWFAIKDGALGEAKEDKYSIVSAIKGEGDKWIISARIRIKQQEIIAPIPVQVKWAGDTPVITLDDIGIPGGNNYSARVLVYGQTYANTWSGNDHAELLNNIITNEKE